MSFSASPLRGCLVLFAALVAVTGCRSNPDRDYSKTSPEALYERAQELVRSQDFNNAIRVYEGMSARYPFSEQTRQARLDLIYAYYRAREPESAIDAADTFIRENPTHPRVDYAWYIKGLVDFERAPNALERLFDVDLSERPPQTARKAFAAFRTVVEQYPNSEYAHDARKRMLYLRNRLADYELSVAQYYMRRNAWVAAAQRAKSTIEQYDGAPAVPGALELLVQAYERLDMPELAEQARQVYAYNYPEQANRVADTKDPWWKFW